MNLNPTAEWLAAGIPTNLVLVAAEPVVPFPRLSGSSTAEGGSEFLAGCSVSRPPSLFADAGLVPVGAPLGATPGVWGLGNGGAATQQEQEVAHLAEFLSGEWWPVGEQVFGGGR